MNLIAILVTVANTHTCSKHSTFGSTCYDICHKVSIFIIYYLKYNINK